MTARLGERFALPFQLILFVLGLITVALLANQMFGSFEAAPANFRGWPAGIEVGGGSGRTAYVGYAALASLAALLGPLSLRALAKEWATANVLMTGFLVASTGAAIAGVALAGTSTMLGGLDMVFYYVGLAAVWLAANAMILTARQRGDADTMFEWLLHSTGLALLPAVIYPLTFVLFPLGLTLEERFVAAVVLGFTGLVIVTFALAQALRASPAPMRADAGPSSVVLVVRENWFLVTTAITLAGAAYVAARAIGITP